MPTLPTMPSIYDIIYGTETRLLEHLQITHIFSALILIIYIILDPYLKYDRRCAATELLLFAGFVYVETSFILQHTDYSDDLLYELFLLALLVEIYTNICPTGRHYDCKLISVMSITLVAWLVSWLCVPRLHEHGFNAMWVSKNWQRKLGFLQDCMGTTDAYCTHTMPQHVKTIFLKRQFIKKWFQTMFLSVAGVVIALLVSILVVIRGREIGTKDKNKIETLKATIQERDHTIQEYNTTMQDYEELQDQLDMETREDNRILTERNAVLQTDLAEAVACNAALQTVLTEVVADNAVLTERNAVLQIEAAEAGARVPQP